MSSKHCVNITGENLTVENILQVAHAQVNVAVDNNVALSMQSSCDFINEAVEKGIKIYGVTTNFGGMAQELLEKKYHSLLQSNLLWGLKCGTGQKIPEFHVRAGMLIRANSLVKGISGIRYELVDRICQFLNEQMTPVVYEHGSIGASGDLVPLSYIAAVVTGLSPTYKVNHKGNEIDALSALNLLGLPPLELKPKEGLALINGTSMMTGIAACCISETNFLFKLALNIHAFFIQSLNGGKGAFEDFVHFNKPHRGQVIIAKIIRDLISGSKLFSEDNKINSSSYQLLQDRYSIRCLPQYLGVIIDGFNVIRDQLQVEANSATDNPLIDSLNQKFYHSGNFMGQYVSVGMDQLRYYLGLVIKHLDTQIALLVTPEFSNGLPASLIGDTEYPIKFGLKGLQICANSLMPQILFYGNSIANLFPTHAEQYNQNINSQGYASANLAWKTISLTRQYLAISLIFAIQAIDLRTYLLYGNFNAKSYLSAELVPLYEAIYTLTNSEPSSQKPFIYHNHEQSFDEYIASIVADLECQNGIIAKAISLQA